MIVKVGRGKFVNGGGAGRMRERSRVGREREQSKVAQRCPTAKRFEGKGRPRQIRTQVPLLHLPAKCITAGPDNLTETVVKVRAPLLPQNNLHVLSVPVCWAASEILISSSSSSSSSIP